MDPVCTLRKAEAVDLYIDYFNEQGEARGEDSESEVWDAVREMLKQVESTAHFEVSMLTGDPSVKVRISPP